MVIDASTLTAILLSEPEAGHFLDVLDASAETLAISPVSVFETVAAVVRVTGCPVVEARVSVSAALKDYGITITEISIEAGEEAITAFDRFGKGRHPAQLNMGDCYSYALAKTLRAPILFKGDDFSRTDFEAAD